MNSEARHSLGKLPQLVRRLSAGLGLVLLMLLPAYAFALEFRCELNGDVRQLSVLIPGAQHLCEVSVDYESTGKSKVMWHADNDSLFCSAKAYALVGKYENELGFSCAKWPDRDGVDELSPTQRSILDLQLRKRLIANKSENSTFEQGFVATVPVSVIAVKATASTPLDHEPGTLAIQYFISDGSDQTEIINDNNTSWSVFATIDNLASRITGKEPVDTALISAISDGGALEIVTNVAAIDGGTYCHGKQVLMPDKNSQVNPRTPHRVVCETSASLNPLPD